MSFSAVQEAPHLLNDLTVTDNKEINDTQDAVKTSVTLQFIHFHIPIGFLQKFH